jgi:hypothetical protein
MRWMMMVIVFISAPVFSMSFNYKKLPKKDEITPLELFQSPIQPGGKWGLNINLENAFKAIVRKVKKKILTPLERRKLLESYCDVLVESEEELVKFRNDDRPVKNWKKIYAEMKARVRTAIMERLISEYGGVSR